MLESNAEISEFILFEFICDCFLLSQISLVLGPSFVGCGSIKAGGQMPPLIYFFKFLFVAKMIQTQLNHCTKVSYYLSFPSLIRPDLFYISSHSLLPLYF